jgi:hypothetical protein
MVIILHLLATVQAYRFFSIGLDDLYKSILISCIKDVPGYNIHHEIASLEALKLISPDSIDIIIVSLEEALIVHELEIFSESFNIPTLFLSSGSIRTFAFYSDLPTECMASSIFTTSTFFSLSRPALVSTFSKINQNIYEESKLNLNSELLHISFFKNSTSSEISLTLSKILKKEGIMNFFFLPDESSCRSLSQGFEDSRLNIKGNIGIFFTNCIYQVNQEGYLILTYDGFEHVETEVEYKSKKILKFINVLKKPGMSRFEISVELLKVFQNSCKFSIVNIQNNTKKKVGIIKDGALELNSTITYIGGIYDLTNYSVPTIVVSANTGSFNPDGAPRAYTNVGHQEGSAFAVEKINRDHSYFPNHKLVLYGQVDCGVSIFNYNYSKACFIHHRPEMGVAYIPTFFGMTMSVLKQLYSLNISLPFIGGIGSTGLLSNKSEFPFFVRTVSPSSDFAYAWANLIRLYGWTKIVVHHTNDSFGMSAYNILYNSQESYGFKFINDQKYRPVDYIFSNLSIPLYREHMKNTLTLGCNIIFFIMGDPTPYFWMEGFYDLGVRRGDYTFVLFTVSGLTNFNAATANVKKRKELMHGTLVIYNGAWVGKYGAEVKEEYLKYRPDAWTRSYFVDAVYSAAETADFLMNQGKAYENPETFMSALRNIRFLGTTGYISFDSDSNDRNIYYYNVFNFYEDSQGKWHDDSVALISPVGTVYYTVLQETVWVNGELPKSMKENYQNCPFRKSQIQDSSSGVNIKIGVSVTLLIVSSSLTIYSLYKLKFRKIRMMEVKSFIVFQDYLTFGFIFVEAIQMISIGPSFVSFNRFLSNLSEILSLNISKVTSFKDTTFWIIFFIMIFLSYFWILVLVFSYFRVLRWFSGLYKNLESFKIYLIPIMSNYLFLPTIVSLISILMCDKAVSDDYSDSYLNYDCNTYCWRDDHIIYSILACIQIIIYIPVAILYRTIWQDENKSLNIRTNSIYLIFKNIVVVVLVIIGKILKDQYELIHGLIFLAVTLTLFVLVIVLKHPFNYDRANLWCKVMIFFVVWNTSVCLFSNFLISGTLAPVILQLLGWVTIATAGVCFQSRLPENLLVSMKGRSIVDLFKFAFGMQSFNKSVYVVSNEEVENLCEEGSGN